MLASIWGGKAGGSGLIEGAERLGGSVVWCGGWCGTGGCGVMQPSVVEVVREGFQLHGVWCVIYSRVPVLDCWYRTMD